MSTTTPLHRVDASELADNRAVIVNGNTSTRADEPTAASFIGWLVSLFVFILLAATVALMGAPHDH